LSGAALVTEEVTMMNQTGMTQIGVLQEIRQMRFEEIYERHRGGRLTQEETAQILGVAVYLPPLESAL
jgi:hypothetical protein